MLLQKETLGELKQRFKLNIYEVKIWTSILSRGVSAASELAEISGVPRSRCYDVLESLEKKGFIVMRIGKPIKYIAVQPEAVVDRVQRKLQEEAEQQVDAVEKISETDIFRDLELLHKTGVKKLDAENVTDHIIGRINVNRFIKAMMLRAQKSLTIVTNEEGVKTKAKMVKKLKDTLTKKRVSITFYTNKPHDLRQSGDINMISTKHNIRFINIDNEEIFFIMPDKDATIFSGVWIKSPSFVGIIARLLEKSGK